MPQIRMDTSLFTLLLEDVKWKLSKLSSAGDALLISKIDMATPRFTWLAKMAVFQLWWPFVRQTAVWISQTSMVGHPYTLLPTTAFWTWFVTSAWQVPVWRH